MHWEASLLPRISTNLECKKRNQTEAKEETKPWEATKGRKKERKKERKEKLKVIVLVSLFLWIWSFSWRIDVKFLFMHDCYGGVDDDDEGIVQKCYLVQKWYFVQNSYFCKY